MLRKWMFYLMIVFLLRLTSSTVFHFIGTQQNWDSSKAACINLGMTMAMIKDQAKWNEVKSYILGLTSIPTNTWVGLFWRPSDVKRFYWVDGAELGAFTDWEISGGEPDCMEPSACGSDENCVRLFRNGDSVLWKTRFCSQNWPVLCEEVPLDPPTTLNNPTTPELETTRDPQTTVDNPTTFFLETTTDQDSRSTYLLRSTTVKETINPTSEYTTENLVTTILESESTFSLATGSTTFVCQNTVTPIPACNCNRTFNGTILNGDSFLFKIDKKKTNAYYRSLTSAYDGRFSAKVLGASGGFIMAALLLCIICLDIIRGSPRLGKARKGKSWNRK